MIKALIIFAVWLLAFVNFGTAQTFNDTQTLRSDLLTGYVTSLRPGENQSVALTVSVELTMVLLKDFDEVTSSFTFVGYLTVTWTDHRLKWSPTNYGELSNLALMQSEIWVPPFLVYNPTEKYTLVGFSTDRVRIAANGSVLWQPPDVFHFICEADVTFFPFDKQTCTITLRTCGYMSTDLNIVQAHDTIQTPDIRENGIWKITSSSTSVSTNMGVEFVHFSMTITRRSAFYVVNFMLPMLAMLVLQLFAFVLPAESGERIGYSITVLLAVSVFLSIVTDFLPTTVIPNIPFICYKLLADFLICTLVMIAAIVNMRCFLKEDEEMSEVTKAFARRVNGKIYKASNVVNVAEETLNKSNNEKLQFNRSDVTWKDVSRALDKICLWVFTIMLLVENTTCFFVLMFA